MGTIAGLGMHEARVRACDLCARDTVRLVLEAPGLARSITPGQFMQLAVPGDASHILRIPLSFSRSCADGSIELIFGIVGEGTRRLAGCSVGSTISVVGPCGHGWRAPSRDGRCLFVAGGVGLAPIIAACEWLDGHKRSCDVVIGARTADMLVEDELAKLARRAHVEVSTDDGTYGHTGFATELVRKLTETCNYAEMYVCGPSPLMARVAEIADAAHIACQVSLERLMGCGFGVCNCCNVELAAGGYAACCSDGPVFDAKEVAW